MPIYTYECEICDEVQDGYNTIAGRHSNAPTCKCGQPTTLAIRPVNLAPILGGGDWQGYMCPVTDTFVTGRRQRRNIMAEHNLIEAGDMKPSKERAAATERNAQAAQN